MAGRLVDYIGSGLDADLPTAAVIDAVLTTNAGAMYYATDVSTLYVLNRVAVAWDSVSAGGGGGGGGGVHVLVGLASGDYAGLAVTGALTSTGNTFASRRYYIPFYPANDFTADEVSLQVNTARTSMRIGVYSDTGGQPDALLYDSGDIDITSTGLKTAAMSSFAFAAGTLYWIALEMVGGSVTVEALLTEGSMAIKNNSPDDVINMYSVTGTSGGALPDPATAVNNEEIGQRVPYVLFRVA